MKNQSIVRAGAALAILSSLLAAPPSEAGLFCWGSKCVAKAQVKKRAAAEFDELRDDIKRDYKGEPLMKVYLTNIDATHKRFNSQADDVLKRERYNEWEFDYIGKKVTQVVIPALKLAVAAAEQVPLAEAPGRFAKTIQETKAASAVFDQNYVQENRAIMLASAGDENEITASPTVGDGKIALGETASDEPTAVTPLETDRKNRPNSNGGNREPLFGRKLTPEEMLAASDVAKLAEDSANYVMNPANGTPDKPGSGGGSGGDSAGGGRRTGRRGNWVSSLMSPEGVSQLFANRGMQELENRNYSEALSLARRALSADPGNRSAMEVLQTVQGRDGSFTASRSAMSPAAAGAAAFEPASFAAGGASAAPSREIAAAALSGAAKVASDEARGGAMNALKLGDARGAIDILSKALAQNPANPALLNLRAQAYGRVGKWDEALKDAVAGLALAPGNAILLNTQALALNRTHRYREALAASEAAIAADPRSAWAFANRAHAYAGLGDKEAMLADLRRAAALDPRFAKTLADAESLQVPSDADVMFLFPGEMAKGAAAAKAPVPGSRAKSFGAVAGAGIVGGLLLALGLLATVMKPLKDTVVSVFTRAKRTDPAINDAVATAQPASAAGNVGGLIRGQYEIARQIGAGGMGMVYEGTDRSLGRRVAIKKMREELRVNARERDRFIIEAKTVASLHHPSIVDIYAIAEEGSDVYLVFEYVDGKTVHDLVQLKGRLDPAESVRVTRAMGEALTYAHGRGVIHRDMKPSNVMLTRDGAVKVMDFGIARMAKDAMTRYSMTNTVVGTPPYMAPEQEQGVVRKESDVYSLAICAYEMLTGKLPFIGIGAGMLMNKINMSYIPPSRNIAGLPEALDEVFLKAFQADPERRYRTPQEFVAAFSTAADGARASRPA